MHVYTHGQKPTVICNYRYSCLCTQIYQYLIYTYMYINVSLYFHRCTAMVWRMYAFWNTYYLRTLYPVVQSLFSQRRLKCFQEIVITNVESDPIALSGFVFKLYSPHAIVPCRTTGENKILFGLPGFKIVS